MVMEVGEAVVGWTDDRRVAGGVVGNGAAVVGARPADQAGPVAVRTRVVPGRSQCTTSRLKRADWRGGMGLCTAESGAWICWMQNNRRWRVLQ